MVHVPGGSDDVLHLGSLLLIQLRNDVVELGALACDGCPLELRFRLRKPDGRAVRPKRRQTHCYAAHI